jgi:hypothetical protein
MANKKFSEFTTKTDSANVDFVVGYDGTTNVKIAPSNLSSGGATSLNGLTDVTITGSGSSISSYFVNIPSGLSGTPSDNLLMQGGGNLTTGSGNTILGDADTGSRITTSSQNVIIGSRAAGNSSAATFQNNIVIGYNAKYSGTGHNAVIIGDNAGVDAGTQTKATIIGDSAGQVGGSETVLIGREAGAYGSDAQTGAVAVGAGQCGRSNTATYTVNVGYATGYSNTSGTGNTNVGYKAGYGVTTALQNTLIGYEAGTDGSLVAGGVTALGYQAGKAFTVGDGAVLIGRLAGGGNSSAKQETVFVGDGAGRYISSAYNTAVGTRALEGATTGGSAAGYNTAIGRISMYQITTGDYNVSVGASSGGGLTSGEYNVLVGYKSGEVLGTGFQNVALGTSTLETTVDKFGNTVAGYASGQFNEANMNTYFGKECGRGNSAGATGFANTAVGASAYNNSTSGAGNIAIGYQCLINGIHTGSNNTFVGRDILSSTAFTGSNSMALGYTATPSAASVSNEITLGNSSIATLRCQVTSITALSDERDKTNIEVLPYGLDFVNSLQPKKFVWDNRAEIRTEIDEQGNESQVEFYSANKGKKDIGFIAQELQSVDDEFTQLVYGANPEKLEASYGRLIPVLVKAIQDLSAKVTALENA